MTSDDISREIQRLQGLFDTPALRVIRDIEQNSIMFDRDPILDEYERIQDLIDPPHLRGIRVGSDEITPRETSFSAITEHFDELYPRVGFDHYNSGINDILDPDANRTYLASVKRELQGSELENEIYQNYQKSIADIVGYKSPAQQAIESFESELGNKDYLSQEFEKLLDPISERNLDSYANVLRLFEHVLPPSFGELAGTFSALLSDPLADQIAHLESGAIGVADKIIQRSDIEDWLADVEAHTHSIDEKLSNIQATLARLDKPERVVFARFVLGVVLSAILGILINVLVMGSPKPIADAEQVEKRIAELAPIEIHKSELANYRFVSVVNYLHVREEGQIEADIVAFVFHGDIVRLIKIDGDWAYVEFRNQFSDEIECGWVAKAFLREFVQ